MNCEYCQSPVHVWFQCPKKPDGWKPARLAKDRGPISRSADSAPKSTAARKDVRQGNSPQPRLAAEVGSAPTAQHYGLAGTQALSVDTPSKRPVGRPKTITDMKVYKAAKAREYRARSKKSTDARKSELTSSRVGSAFEAAPITKRPVTPRRSKGSGGAGSDALPVDTIPVQDAKAMTVNTVATVAPEPAQEAQILRPGPLPKFNKKAWMREYMREYMRKRRAKE